MWIYRQSDGSLTKDGISVDSGYSGHGEGLNNPSMEATPDVGPIPAGDWAIEGPPQDHAEHGPYVLKLEPKRDTVTFGRDGFLIHGDEVGAPGQHLASKGCIVLAHATRSRIWQSGDNNLTVIQ